MFLKVLVYIIIFAILHFSYDFTGWSILKPFGGIDESVFQHLKMAFFSYLLASVIEYTYSKKKFKGFKVFFIPRLFVSIIIPWIIFLIWYLIPAIYGKFNSISAELIWAIVVTILSGILGVKIERELQDKEFSRSFTIIILLLGIISIFLYVSFTYKLPWIDLFQNPEGT